MEMMAPHHYNAPSQQPHHYNAPSQHTLQSPSLSSPSLPNITFYSLLAQQQQQHNMQFTTVSLCDTQHSSNNACQQHFHSCYTREFFLQQTGNLCQPRNSVSGHRFRVRTFFTTAIGMIALEGTEIKLVHIPLFGLGLQTRGSVLVGLCNGVAVTVNLHHFSFFPNSMHTITTPSQTMLASQHNANNNHIYAMNRFISAAVTVTDINDTLNSTTNDFMQMGVNGATFSQHQQTSTSITVDSHYKCFLLPENTLIGNNIQTLRGCYLDPWLNLHGPFLLNEKPVDANCMLLVDGTLASIIFFPCTKTASANDQNQPENTHTSQKSLFSYEGIVFRITYREICAVKYIHLLHRSSVKNHSSTSNGKKYFTATKCTGLSPTELPDYVANEINFARSTQILPLLLRKHTTQCDHCGRSPGYDMDNPQKEQKKYIICARCNQGLYCSEACQWNAWPVHRCICKPFLYSFSSPLSQSSSLFINDNTTYMFPVEIPMQGSNITWCSDEDTLVHCVPICQRRMLL
jgi:hypothetical protein